ncbi:retroviral-like aspartic protease family protein [Candidatus Bathyarchaeota archaeon]|nr:retroviral-like aspartic protease family protein [Candidatus Bathyarchaeota archaeon]
MSKPFSDLSMEFQARLDSGADMTVVPQHAINELRLIPASRISVKSFDGRAVWRYTYYVNLSFQDFEFRMVEVIASKREDMLLGRDILNRLKAILDGKRLSFSLLDPPDDQSLKGLE